MGIVASVLVALAIILPIALPWFILILAPFVLIVVIPLIPILLVFYPDFLRTTKENRSARASLEPRLLRPSGYALYKERMEFLLRKRLEQMDAPFRACSCLSLDGEKDGEKITLVARFIDHHHSFSHRVQGLTLDDAFAKLEWKIVQERVGVKPVTIERISGRRPEACAFQACCNAKFCPARASAKRHYQEMTAVHTIA